MEAVGITALAEDGSDSNNGLDNEGSAVRLYGGSFTARGGNDAYGIRNHFDDATLQADGITVLAENGADNYSLEHTSGATATLHGGSFTAREGTNAVGIRNEGSGTTLEAYNVAVLGEGSNNNAGIYNHDSAVATLRGGSFVGYGGTYARGIYNFTSATLIAERITALGKDGTNSYGLYQQSSATAMADSSQFTGSTNALTMNSGSVQLGVSKLDGEANRTGGTLTCFQVYTQSYSIYTCP